MVIDDSPSVSMGELDDPAAFDANVAARRAELAAAPARTLLKAAHDCFRYAGNGYRPLSSLYYSLSFGYLYYHHRQTFGHLLAVGAVYGLFAVVSLLVARRFVRHENPIPCVYPKPSEPSRDRVPSKEEFTNGRLRPP